MLNVDNNTPVYTDFNGLAKLKNEAREQSPEAIQKVAQQFESLFLNMVMKSMRDAKLGEGLMDSQQSQFYQEMYDQQMAVQLSNKPGIGLAALISQQLSPKKPDEQDKMALGDYLNRALGTGQAPAVANHAAVANGKPLDDSGLSDLERTLAALEQSQQTVEKRWQLLDGQAQVSKQDAELSLSENKQQFVDSLRPYAQQAADELGVEPEVLIAQAALETGWGQSVIRTGQGDNSFNLFNIKADKSWQGKQARVSTLEFDGGVARKEMAGFRSYDSYRESFNDYVQFIKSNPRYTGAIKMAGNAERYMHELQKAGYATDPKYADKVLSIYKQQLDVS